MINRLLSTIWRAACSCTNSSDASVHGLPYRELNRPNKYGVPIVEKAEMLDPEDRSWV